MYSGLSTMYRTPGASSYALTKMAFVADLVEPGLWICIPFDEIGTYNFQGRLGIVVTPRDVRRISAYSAIVSECGHHNAMTETDSWERQQTADAPF